MIKNQEAQRGNIFAFVLLGIVLVGALTIAIRGFAPGSQTITQEQMMIESARTVQYGAELEQAVKYVLDNGASEIDIRFSAPSADAAYGTISTTPIFQVFSQSGGRAEYRIPASTVTTGKWAFYGRIAVPGVGSDKSDLVAVLPDVSLEFCKALHKMLKLSEPEYYSDIGGGSYPDVIDAGSSYYFGPSNDYDDGTIYGLGTTPPPLGTTQACFFDTTGPHYYRVLLAR
jgi:hypothetical protein